MRYSGKITEWNEEKGYGFVMRNGGESRVFIHIKSFESLHKRPSLGDLISYRLQKDNRGRLNAIDAKFAGFSGLVAQMRNNESGRIVFPAVFIIAISIGWVMGKVPSVILLGYGAMSVLTFLFYGVDKFQAINQLWRTKEVTLHLLAFLGGWPGALFAQRLFHHKSRKKKFQLMFWFTVLLNCALFGWLIYSGTASVIDSGFIRWVWGMT